MLSKGDKYHKFTNGEKVHNRMSMQNHTLKKRMNNRKK